VQDGKTVLEKAQNLKRKVSNEENTGIKNSASLLLGQDDIKIVAKYIDINLDTS
jgi:hypothetical protein